VYKLQGDMCLPMIEDLAKNQVKSKAAHEIYHIYLTSHGLIEIDVVLAFWLQCLFEYLCP